NHSLLALRHKKEKARCASEKKDHPPGQEFPLNFFITFSTFFVFFSRIMHLFPTISDPAQESGHCRPIPKKPDRLRSSHDQLASRQIKKENTQPLIQKQDVMAAP